MITEQEIQTWWDALTSSSREQRSADLGMAVEDESWQATWDGLTKTQRQRLLAALKHPLSE